MTDYPRDNFESRKRREVMGYSAREDHPVSEARYPEKGMVSSRPSIGDALAEFEDELLALSKNLDTLTVKLYPVMVHEDEDRAMLVGDDSPQKPLQSAMRARIADGVELLQAHNESLKALCRALDLT